jgi:hypothetical protein
MQMTAADHLCRKASGLMDDLPQPLPCHWLALPPDVLPVVLMPLPALELARLGGTCVALRAATRAVTSSRLTALRPASAALERRHEQQGADGETSQSERLHRLEGCCGRIVALGGFDTTRLAEDCPEDDQHDDEGCLADVELLRQCDDSPQLQQSIAPAPLRVRRADVAAVCLDGGWVYAVGGRCGAADHSSVARLDLATGRWRDDVEPMTVPLSGCAASRLGGSRLLVAGGAYRPSWRATSLVQIYDARSDSWNICSEMSQFRYFSSAVALTPAAAGADSSPRVAVLGGVSQTGTQMGGNQEPNVYRPRLVEIYHGADDIWSHGPQLLAERYGCAAAVLPGSGRVAALGGTDASGQRLGAHSAEAVDLRVATGVALAPLPVELWGAAAAAVHRGSSSSEIVVCGGCVARQQQQGQAHEGVGGGAIVGSRDESVAQCHVYEERADRWREAPDMVVGRWCGSATVCTV